MPHRVRTYSGPSPIHAPPRHRPPCEASPHRRSPVEPFPPGNSRRASAQRTAPHNRFTRASATAAAVPRCLTSPKRQTQYSETRGGARRVLGTPTPHQTTNQPTPRLPLDQVPCTGHSSAGVGISFALGLPFLLPCGTGTQRHRAKPSRHQAAPPPS